MKKRIFAAIAAGAVISGVMSMSGCTVTNSNYNAMVDYDFSSVELVQLQPPEDGDTIAIIDTDLGEFRAVLYDDICPNSVKAFVDRANAGEYDNMPVYGVLKDTYFLTGGRENDKGEYVCRNDDSEAIELEYSVDLWPFKGSLVTYSELPGYSDARYLVCNVDSTITQEDVDDLKKSIMDSDNRTDVEKSNITNLFDKFIEVGGVFGMAGYVTVFGQTYEGMDVVEQLCALQSDESTYRALDTVMIKSVKISQYDSSAAE